MMKSYSLLLVLGVLLVFSCSSDKDSDMADKNSIEGTWDATEFVIDENTASDSAKNGRDILNYLTTKDCYILTFTFSNDLSVTVKNSTNYVEISVNSSGTGLEVPCPNESDIESRTYTFDGKVLVIDDGTGETIIVDVTIDGDTMTINAVDLDILNFNDGGQLVFVRR